MSPIPTLYTPRLILRPFTLADAARIQHLAGNIKVASTTLNIPHPYPDGAAESWINTHQPQAEAGENFVFAITLAGTRTPNRELDPSDTGHLIGAINLATHADTNTAELGYWLGAPYWNKGFTTEAANAALQFAFTRRHVDAVIARHCTANPASGRVMEKLAMTREPGTSFVEKAGVPLELNKYALTRDQWSRRQYIHRWKPLRPARALVTT